MAIVAYLSAVYGVGVDLAFTYELLSATIGYNVIQLQRGIADARYTQYVHH